ncbi:molybdenum ABC transporter ATP-binding protein [Candidatus Electronema sp. PJ]|uniref:molybdenum ABC transporter ATP-binding protein n=1 Tax=Candidatus Electronema sp. PJ TaxID=3401572 RepID=UPI003AA982BC
MLLEVAVEKRFEAFQFKADFTLRSDKCGVFGPSGSGKSTLMHLLAGLLQPDKGVVRLNGRVLFDQKQKINLLPEERQVGVVFQHCCLFPHLNVRQNLFYGRNRLPRLQRNISPDQLIRVLQLDELLERSVHRLSGGERQRVALGRTVLACPQLILLDEPLSGLDRALKYQIIPYLRNVFAEFSIPLLFISHSLQELRLMTEEVLIMRDGQAEKTMLTEDLARVNLGSIEQGYSNLLQLDRPQEMGNLRRYQWGKVFLIGLNSDEQTAGQFVLGARDILLFKKHPEAASARNMLACTVRRLYQTDWLAGVELDCQGNTLIAEIVPQSVEELEISPGSEVIAVFKASALRRLYSSL